MKLNYYLSCSLIALLFTTPLVSSQLRLPNQLQQNVTGSSLIAPSFKAPVPPFVNLSQPLLHQAPQVVPQQEVINPLWVYGITLAIPLIQWYLNKAGEYAAQEKFETIKKTYNKNAGKTPENSYKLLKRAYKYQLSASQDFLPSIGTCLTGLVDSQIGLQRVLLQKYLLPPLIAHLPDSWFNSRLGNIGINVLYAAASQMLIGTLMGLFSRSQILTAGLNCALNPLTMTMNTKIAQTAFNDMGLLQKKDSPYDSINDKKTVEKRARQHLITDSARKFLHIKKTIQDKAINESLSNLTNSVDENKIKELQDKQEQETLTSIQTTFNTIATLEKMQKLPKKAFKKAIIQEEINAVTTLLSPDVKKATKHGSDALFAEEARQISMIKKELDDEETKKLKASQKLTKNFKELQKLYETKLYAFYSNLSAQAPTLKKDTLLNEYTETMVTNLTHCGVEKISKKEISKKLAKAYADAHKNEHKNKSPLTKNAIKRRKSFSSFEIPAFNNENKKEVKK